MSEEKTEKKDKRKNTVNIDLVYPVKKEKILSILTYLAKNSLLEGVDPKEIVTQLPLCGGYSFKISCSTGDSQTGELEEKIESPKITDGQQNPGIGENLSIDDLAKKLEVSKATVYNVCKKIGVPMLKGSKGNKHFYDPSLVYQGIINTKGLHKPIKGKAKELLENNQQSSSFLSSPHLKKADENRLEKKVGTNNQKIQKKRNTNYAITIKDGKYIEVFYLLKNELKIWAGSPNISKDYINNLGKDIEVIEEEGRFYAPIQKVLERVVLGKRALKIKQTAVEVGKKYGFTLTIPTYEPPKEKHREEIESQKNGKLSTSELAEKIGVDRQTVEAVFKKVCKPTSIGHAYFYAVGEIRQEITRLKNVEGRKKPKLKTMEKFEEFLKTYQLQTQSAIKKQVEPLIKTKYVHQNDSIGMLSRFYPGLTREEYVGFLDLASARDIIDRNPFDEGGPYFDMRGLEQKRSKLDKLVVELGLKVTTINK